MKEMTTEQEKAFAHEMEAIERLRKQKADQLQRRDRSEWDCFFHFACQSSLLRKQAE